MVRLNPWNPELQSNSNENEGSSANPPLKPGEGAQAQIVDDLLASVAGGNAGKRSHSSLDYKSSNPESIIPGPEVKAKASSHQQGGGKPPRDFSQEQQEAFLRSLKDKSNEEILKILQENPELAAQLNLGGAGSGSGGSSSAGSGSARGSKRAASSKEERLGMLKDQGFPFVQWAVLTLVTLYGVYMLYTFIKQETAPMAPVSSKKTQNLKRGKGKNKKQVSRSVDVDKVVAEIEGPNGTASKNDHSPSRKAKIAPKKKPVQQQQPRKAAAPKKDDTDSDESGSDDDDEPVAPPPKAKAQPKAAAPQAKPAPAKQTQQQPSKKVEPAKEQKKDVAPVAPAPVVAVSDDEDDGFIATTSKKNKKKKGSAGAAVTAPAPVVTKNGAKDSPAMNGGVKEETPADHGLSNGTSNAPDPAADESFQEVTTKKSKKKKKAATNDAGTAGGASKAIESDEALALRLQAEENGDVSPTTGVVKEKQPEQDEWAEVSVKKHKRKKDIPVAVLEAAE